MLRELHDGREDGFEPLESLDIKAATGFADMLKRMSKTAFGGRELGEAFEVLLAMAQDPDCTIVVTMSGAMTVAKMGLILCEMIENDLAHIIVSTGAIMAHGLSEAIGLLHFKYEKDSVSDEQLYKWGYDRVYDTLELEANLYDTERLMMRALDRLDPAVPTCSREINRAVGEELLEQGQVPSILGSARKKGVPVYVPAFTDSELGLDTATRMIAAARAKQGDLDLDSLFSTMPAFNPFLDLYDYTRRVLQAERLGIFTIGGGVPRNWAQQVGPFVEIINVRGGLDIPIPRFTYGVRICPEPVHWGGLSGCTYSEGVSWGKFVSPKEGGRFAEVHCDATIAWPFLVRGVLEALGKLA